MIKLTTGAIGLVLVMILIIPFIYLFYQFSPPRDHDLEDKITEVELMKVDEADIIEGIHVPTGLIADAHLALVISNCTVCHSSKLIIQNKLSAEGWDNLIQWMQQTQNLWDLGENKKLIVSYLAKNYSPGEQGRRKPLSDIEWYELK